MSVSGTDKNSLLLSARAAFVRNQQLKSIVTGKPAETLPTNAELITSDPVLQQKIKKLDNSQPIQATTSSTTPGISKSSSPVVPGSAPSTETTSEGVEPAAASAGANPVKASGNSGGSTSVSALPTGQIARVNVTA